MCRFCVTLPPFPLGGHDGVLVVIAAVVVMMAAATAAVVVVVDTHPPTHPPTHATDLFLLVVLLLALNEVVEHERAAIVGREGRHNEGEVPTVLRPPDQELHRRENLETGTVAVAVAVVVMAAAARRRRRSRPTSDND